MANADFNRLMDQLRIRLPGALDGTLQLELFSVMNEFFQNSNCWSEDIPMRVTPSRTTYEIVSTTPSLINRLLDVKTSSGVVIAARMPQPGTIELFNAPSQDDVYTVQVALTITDPVDREGYPEFPDWFLAKYGNDILDGVLGRMMSQLAKPYSQPQLAQYHMRRFTQAVNRAGVEALHGHVFRGQYWKFPQTFARRKARW